MRRVPYRPGPPVKASGRGVARAVAAVLAVAVFFAAEAPAHAAGPLAALPAPSTGLNALIAAVVGLGAGGLTFYLRTRGRRGPDRD